MAAPPPLGVLSGQASASSRRSSPAFAAAARALRLPAGLTSALTIDLVVIYKPIATLGLIFYSLLLRCQKLTDLCLARLFTGDGALTGHFLTLWYRYQHLMQFPLPLVAHARDITTPIGTRQEQLRSEATDLELLHMTFFLGIALLPIFLLALQRSSFYPLLL
ncbi:unnamed protein product [Miscanthus lutarioriparius]|uniref:Uncharacterized protein n=1 Tax=Miscanthus lutarioriparius TaxID=422564 RepID=A0A811RRP4_9POAL|nr:unnamed protein product [Miscanthus lutarioriparius]